MYRSFQPLGRLGTFLALAFMPVAGWADPPAEPSHVVKRGDTLGAIARQNNVSVEALRAANGLERKQPIQAGQTLALPAPQGDEHMASNRSASLGTTAEKGVRPGVVRLVRGTETLQTRVLDRRRHLVANTLAEFTRFLRFPDGATHTIDPRLVTLLGMVSDHFGGRDVIVVSGFRPYSPRQYTPHSNHNVGRALDFTIRGVTNEKLRDFCRTFRNVGVGYYPNSSFVHFDVRDSSAFWVDFAGPGQAPRYHRPESKDDADESVSEVEGVATVDHPGGAKSRSDETPSPGSTTDGKESGSSLTRDSTGEHSVFPGH
jgi:uncharacterized protein YcbK (DUF882 family)